MKYWQEDEHLCYSPTRDILNTVEKYEHLFIKNAYLAVWVQGRQSKEIDRGFFTIECSWDQLGEGKRMNQGEAAGSRVELQSQ